MNIIHKIIRGDDIRKSRIHTDSNELCGMRAILDLWRAGLTWFRFKATGKYSIEPWWVYQAIHEVNKVLKPTDRVLEVGGGYSTVWLAERCQQIYSIEESRSWAKIVLEQASGMRLNNIQMLFGESLSVFREQLGTAEWNVVIIDGSNRRFEIFQALLASSKKPRLVIYDDTDKIENRKALFETMSGYDRNIYRGFKPQTIHACETTVYQRLKAK